MKKLLILFLSLILLVGCSKKQYADDRKCADIGKCIPEVLADSQEYHEFDTTHMNANFQDNDHYDDRYVIYSADTNDINEIGIFHADSEEHADALVKDCKRYIDDMQQNSRAFIGSYAPEQLPKLDDAKVQRVGNYIIYTVLDESKADALIERIKSDLKM